MPYADKKQYKNPAIPKGGGVLPSTQKALRAPIRGPGFMQMDAAATARQPKFGSPDIPVTGQADYKRQAAQQMAMGAAATAEPATRAKAAEGMMSRSVAGAPPITTPALTVPIAFTAAQPAATPAGVTEVVPGAVERITGGAQKPGGEELPQAAPVKEDPLMVKEEQQVGAGQPAPVEGGVALEAQEEETGMTVANAQAGILKDEEGDFWQDGEKLEKSYDDEGNWNGYFTAGGQFYDKNGKPSETGDVAGGATGVESHPMKLKIKFQGWALDYLSKETGISEEDVADMVQNIENASVDQMHRMAQTMASRGMGASGLIQLGMGDIHAQALEAILTVHFEAKKVNAQADAEKFKTIAALYGGILSDENRIAVAREVERAKAKESSEIMDMQKWENFQVHMKNYMDSQDADGWAKGAFARAQQYYADNKHLGWEELNAGASKYMKKTTGGKMDFTYTSDEEGGGEGGEGGEGGQLHDIDEEMWGAVYNQAYSQFARWSEPNTPGGMKDLLNPESFFHESAVNHVISNFIFSMEANGIDYGTKEQAADYVRQMIKKQHYPSWEG